jgi:hypothetical protein
MPRTSLEHPKEEWNSKLLLSDFGEEHELRSSSKWFKPSCFSINYDAVISQSSIDISQHLKANKALNEKDDE